MSAPKSVVKIKKDHLEFTSNVDTCNYYMYELCRAALRDSAKIVKRRFNQLYYEKFRKKTGNAGRATKYTVFSNSKTKYPRVEIGLRNQAVPGFYGYFQEVGSSKQPKLGLLQKAVDSNIAEIITAQSKYLSALEDEAEALSLISEEEYEDDE